MSRWLSSVNSLLEQLDGQVETAVEEKYNEADDADAGEHGMQSNLDKILAKRGLSESDKEGNTTKLVAAATSFDEGNIHVPVSVRSDGELDDSSNGNGNDNADTIQKEIVDEHTVQVKEEEIQISDQQIHTSAELSSDEKLHELNSVDSYQNTPNNIVAGVTNAAEDADHNAPVHLPSTIEKVYQVDAKHQEQEQSDVVETSLHPALAGSNRDDSGQHIKIKETSTSTVVASTSANSKPPAPLPHHVHGSSELNDEQIVASELQLKKALADTREAQKETRTMRRHVVSLNSELETAEGEIQAQRTELERAAERFERDRTRHKEKKEILANRHKEELKSLKAQNEQTLAESKTRADGQLEDARKRLRQVDDRRMQEGGDMTKGLEEALHREQEATQRMAMLEDEKSTLLSQVSSLQVQQSTLESRVESVVLTSDNAMDRETEAEDRLDKALSLHARQLCQRQARESELERTVADLGAALVVARNREISRLKTAGSGDNSTRSSGGTNSTMNARMAALDDDLETAKAQLILERQRSETLHQELQDVSKEMADETSAAHARQLQNDRKVADLSLTLSRLQSNVRENKDIHGRPSQHDPAEEDNEKNLQIASLSEQILRQQEKNGNTTSEISALKSRLRAALSRAESAEIALTFTGNTDDAFDAMEAATSSGNGSNGPPRSMRRRGRNRRGGTDSYGGSIRSAILLSPGQTSDRKERIGKAVDVLDKISVNTGKFLRYNPLARGAFLIYLILLHSWTFLMLFFHVHAFEPVHGDFGAGQMPHAPHAMMQKSYPT